MTGRIRLLILLARPAVVVLLGLFTAIGLAQAGRSGNHLLLARGLAAVMGFLLFSVALNDLADEAIDRVNLPGDRRRPLVAGTVTRRELVAMAAVAAVVALAVSATLHWAAAVAVAAGLALSMAYSLRPLRVADRGVAASLLLPAGYVAVPYLVGVLGGRGSIHPGDLALLGGLYAGFIGRIVLKEFRDVHGDRLFGKRTFLVRHGRRWTCAFSVACWVAGSVTLAVIKQPSWTLAVPRLARCAERAGRQHPWSGVDDGRACPALPRRGSAPGRPHPWGGWRCSGRSLVGGGGRRRADAPRRARRGCWVRRSGRRAGLLRFSDRSAPCQGCRLAEGRRTSMTPPHAATPETPARFRR